MVLLEQASLNLAYNLPKRGPMSCFSSHQVKIKDKLHQTFNNHKKVHTCKLLTEMIEMSPCHVAQ